MNLDQNGYGLNWKHEISKLYTEFCHHFPLSLSFWVEFPLLCLSTNAALGATTGYISFKNDYAYRYLKLFGAPCWDRGTRLRSATYAFLGKISNLHHAQGTQGRLHTLSCLLSFSFIAIDTSIFYISWFSGSKLSSIGKSYPATSTCGSKRERRQENQRVVLDSPCYWLES